VDNETVMRMIRVAGIAALVTLGGGGHHQLLAETDGSLRVESDPAGASVYVDSRKVGETPITLTIEPGEHR
jgi:hypothetical protein